MEPGDCEGARRNQKRKFSDQECEDGDSAFCLDELNQDLLEKVLSWLPTSTFFRASSVCKRWKSLADSATFKLACSQVPSREPWYFMVDSQFHLNYLPVVYDSAESNWKKLNHLPLFQGSETSCRDFIPVAASGALICFLNGPDQFIVCNPVTGAFREIAYCQEDDQPVAIAMASATDSYKLVLVSGETPNLWFRVYNSETGRWGERVVLSRKMGRVVLSRKMGCPFQSAPEDENAVYFLSKCGNVVSTNLQRTPCKKYSSIIVQKDGEEIMYFLSSTGAVIVCNLASKCYYEYPRLLPVYSEYSIDLVECGGEVYAVVLSEFLESASLRVWKYEESARFWRQIAAMPPSMSHEFYGKKMDINCTAAGHQILVCLSSSGLSLYFSCNLAENEWVGLPHCYTDGKPKEFVCAFSLEPRIEAAV